MYNTKYYSFKDKKYIYKTILTQSELKFLKKALSLYTKVDYGKLFVKPLDINQEYKFSSSPNSIGLDAIKKIEKSKQKHYVIELLQEEMEEMYHELFKAVILLQSDYEIELKRQKEEKEEDEKVLAETYNELKSIFGT